MLQLKLLSLQDFSIRFFICIQGSLKLNSLNALEQTGSEFTFLLVSSQLYWKPISRMCLFSNM